MFKLLKMENLQEKLEKGYPLMREIDTNISNSKSFGEFLGVLRHKLDLEIKKLESMVEQINVSNNIAEDFADDIDNVSYSIGKCDCCEEEYILETHTNSKGETTEEKPFDFGDSSPAQIFKMGFDACAKNTRDEDTNIGIQFPDGNKLLIQVFSEGGINVEVKTTKDKAWRPPVLSEFELSVKNSDVFDSEDKLIA